MRTTAVGEEELQTVSHGPIVDIVGRNVKHLWAGGHIRFNQLWLKQGVQYEHFYLFQMKEPPVPVIWIIVHKKCWVTDDVVALRWKFVHELQSPC